MNGNDEEYRMLVKISAARRELMVREMDTHITVTIDGRDISVNHLTWLQLMGLMETWDII